jgi:uncharacterized membrane protein
MCSERNPMTDYIFVGLLIGHILAIVGWMGAALLFTSVLSPSLETMASSARSEFLVKAIPRYTTYVASTSGAAVVLGIALYGYAIVYASKSLPTGVALTLLQAGAGVGLVAFIIVMALVLPSARHLLRIVKEGQSGTMQPAGRQEAIARVQSRVRTGTIGVLGLLVLVLILMVAGSTI